MDATKFFPIENTDGIVEIGKKKATKSILMPITGLGFRVPKLTNTGKPSTDGEVLRKLAGNPREKKPVYGIAFEHFDNPEEGKEACEAIDSLIRATNVETLLNNFILPLPQQLDINSRVHCSLNLNTETGRLSARKPNLQNQPALEKDIYKIRHAFDAEVGKTLIVADYGQLELRILAHMTRCNSMLEAFKVLVLLDRLCM